MILIIFDIDGTLVHSNKIDSQCFAETYEQVFDKTFPSIDWRDYPHVTDDTIFATVFEKHFNRTATPTERDHFKTQFVKRIIAERKKQPAAFHEVPGAKAIIHRLLEDPYYIVGIGTGGWHSPAMTKLDFVNIPTDDLYISAADDCPTRVHIVNRAIRLAKAAHPTIEKIIYVGDASWDVTTCNDMNIPLIGIRVRGDVEVLKAMGVTDVFKNFLDPEAFLTAVTHKL